jgi:hypothetical protein
MNATPWRLGGFVAALAALFGVAAFAGGAVGADAPGGETPAHADEAAGPHGGGAHAGAADPVRGLAVADRGLRLVVDTPELRRGADERLRFRIVGEGGRPVRDFDVEHTKRMHVIVVRRDLTGFQHLHPAMAADGTWSVPVRLDAAGSHRMFADFSHEGQATTLAADLRVDGAADLRPLPAPTATAVSEGGYDVRLDAASPRAGRAAELRFTVTRDGRPVDVEPYLGAGGHLVALREGDLAFLHVHPDEHGLGFAATFPTEGRYRLFLQFKVDGRVQTAAFTLEVA